MFVGEEAEVDIIHAEREQPVRGKPKDQGEELVEINLVAQEAEPEPIFVNAEFTSELRQAFLVLLQEF